MTKTKKVIYIIASCQECKWIEFINNQARCGAYVSGGKLKKLPPISEIDDIPDWCPLEDSKEASIEIG